MTERMPAPAMYSSTARRCGNRGIRAVVTGPVRLGRDDRLARDALVERLGLARVRDEVLLGLEGARGVGGAELVDGRVDEVDA